MGQEAPVAPGPQKELLSVLRPTSLCPPERGSLLMRPFGEQENPAFGVPGPLRIEGLGDWLAEEELSKGVLSSASTPVGVGRTASASCQQQLAQTRAQAIRWLPAVHQSQTLSTLLLASWVKGLAGASGSCCPLQVTWQLAPS